MEFYEAVVTEEVKRYIPFLLTTTVMREVVKGGAGREGAHEAIKEHAVAVARELRSGAVRENDLMKRLAGDKRLGLSEAKLSAVLEAGRKNIGDAAAQVDAFPAKIDSLAAKHPQAAKYEPGEIL